MIKDFFMIVKLIAWKKRLKDKTNHFFNLNIRNYEKNCIIANVHCNGRSHPISTKFSKERGHRTQ